MFPNIRIMLLAVCAFVLSGCGSARLLTVDDRVNVGIGDSDAVTTHFSEIKARLSKGEVIDRKTALLALGIEDEKKATVEDLKRPDIQSYLSGGATPLMNDMKFIELLDHLTGVRIPFTGHKQHITLSGGVYVNTYESGYDIAVVLIFKDGVIRNADQIGVLSTNRVTKRILWDPSSGIGGVVSRHF